jgi:hypothetical protein
LRLDISETFRRLFPGGPSAAIGVALLVILFSAAWLFGWNKPARSDLVGLMEISFLQNDVLTALRTDGASTEIRRGAIAEVGEVDCHGESTRRQPTVHYRCYYELIDSSGAGMRIVIAADYNRGWRRLGMADFGDYRLEYLSPQRQLELLSAYGR